MPDDQSPRPIEYGRPDAPRPWHIPAAIQFILGLAATFTTIGSIVALLAQSVFRPALCFSLPVGVLISLVVYLRVRHQWRFVLPGVVMGFSLCCLVGFVGVGAIIYTCGHH